jgi:hypothetical protein
MEKKSDVKLNSNGSTTTIETIEIKPDDGWIPLSEIRPVMQDRHIKRYRKGYSKTFVYSTNDLRITRPFLYSICGLFFIIGLFITVFGLWIIGIPFIVISIFTFFKCKKDIDKISEELKSKGYDVKVDSKEEKEQIKKEIKDTIGGGFKDVAHSVFTKEAFSWFLKASLPIYCIIAIIVSIIIGIVINVFLGLIILVILALCGLVYYYLISKLFKH